MVHPKVGMSGALAQNAVRKQKEASAMVPITKNNPIKVCTNSKMTKEDKKKEKKRAKYEFELLEKMNKEGKDLNGKNGKIDLTNIDAQINLKLEADELSGSTESDSDEEEAGQLDEKNVPEAMPVTKRFQRFQIDKQDFKLQYCTGLSKPVYFDQYAPHSKYPTFYRLDIAPDTVDVHQANKALLEYSNQVLATVVPQKLTMFPKELVASMRFTAPHVNMCVNPLQALRGWGILGHFSQNKTNSDVVKFVEKYMRQGITSSATMHQNLLNAHVACEEDFDGCVRLFTELPRHLNHDEELLAKTDIHYGGKSRRSGTQHHCFATDPDGFYSCYRINEEISLSTRGFVRYVVPEPYAPNWRASLVLASAMDCTFYWKTAETDVTEIPTCQFSDPYYENSICTGWHLIADYQEKNGVYRFGSQYEGMHLFIIPEKDSDAKNEKEIDPKYLRMIEESDTWQTISGRKIFLPKATTALPLSLYQHANTNGLDRIFCSEKSELLHMKKEEIGQRGAQFTTLYDHYHKAVFEIQAKPPPQNVSRKFDQLKPGKFHQCIDESSATLFGKYQELNKNESKDVLFTYYEDQLDHNLAVFEPVFEQTPLFVPAEQDLNLAIPFYYIFTRELNGKPLIVCAGYFNNTIWSKTKKAYRKLQEEKEAKDNQEAP